MRSKHGVASHRLPWHRRHRVRAAVAIFDNHDGGPSWKRRFHSRPRRSTLPVPHPPWLTPSRYRGFPALLPDMAGHPGKDDPSLLRGPYGINGDILRSKTLVYYFITLLHSHYPVFFPFWGFAGITHAHALPPLTTTHVRTNRTRCRHGGGASPGAMFCFFLPCTNYNGKKYF